MGVVNPARVRQFARACGLLAKTDKLDAQVLAVFGQIVQPRHYEGKTEAEKQLGALLVRRRQLEEMLKAEQNRLRTISPSLRSSVERIIAMLKEEKKRIDEQIREMMKDQEAWQEQTEILGSAPGVGVVTTAFQPNEKTATRLTGKTVAARCVGTLLTLRLPCLPKPALNTVEFFPIPYFQLVAQNTSPSGVASSSKNQPIYQRISPNAERYLE